MNALDKKLQEIANALLSYKPIKYGFEGCRGVALFLLQYYKHSNNELFYDKAITLIEKEFKHYSNIYNDLSFWSGISGLGWFCNTIIKQIDSEYDSGINLLDSCIEKKMLEDKRFGIYYYDYLNGNLGLANYFISTNQTKPLSNLVDELHKNAIQDSISGGIKWKSNTQHKENTYDYNISLSHGMSSIIVMLSKIYNMGIQEAKCKQMINNATRYILSQKLPEGKHLSLFGTMALESLKFFNNSRLGWCYGDLCVAIALWRASIALNSKDLFDKSQEIFLHASKRRSLKQNNIMDACFCHGSSGIAYIFNKIYGYTNKTEYKDAADYWINITLMQSCSGHYPAGYRKWQGDNNYISEYGILEGIAGIGLSLLSFVSHNMFDWDDCLLLS